MFLIEQFMEPQFFHTMGVNGTHQLFAVRKYWVNNLFQNLASCLAGNQPSLIPMRHIGDTFDIASTADTIWDADIYGPDGAS